MAFMTINIKIYGQVQGVFFRRSAKEEADRLGLFGWVRNDGDGSVETLAVGSKEKLDEFVKWCKKGPSLAQVERVEVDWQESVGDFDRFDIL